MATKQTSSTGSNWTGTRAQLSRFLSKPLATFGFVLFVLVATLAIFAPHIAPQDPYDLSQISLINSRLPPGAVGFDNVTYWLGTDAQGRDMLSAILYGLRTSMFVGIMSSLIALVIGTVAGLTAGYVSGRTDAFIMRLVDLQLSIPSILVALILLSALGRGVENIIFALVTVQWVYFARTARAQVSVERGKPYVEAGRLLGYSNMRLLFIHILPMHCLRLLWF